MKPIPDRTLCTVMALLLLLFLAIAPNPLEGKEETTQQTRSLPTFIDFGRGTCMPCKMMKPTLEGLKKEYAGILNIEIIDVRYNQEAMKKYKVPGVPFQIVLDSSGRELKRHYGYMDKEEILAMLKAAGIELRKTPVQKK